MEPDLFPFGARRIVSGQPLGCRAQTAISLEAEITPRSRVMTDDKIERLDLTKVAVAKSKDGPNPKVKVAEHAREQKPAAPDRKPQGRAFAKRVDRNVRRAPRPVWVDQVEVVTSRRSGGGTPPPIRRTRRRGYRGSDAATSTARPTLCRRPAARRARRYRIHGSREEGA